MTGPTSLAILLSAISVASPSRSSGPSREVDGYQGLLWGSSVAMVTKANSGKPARLEASEKGDSQVLTVRTTVSGRNSRVLFLFEWGELNEVMIYFEDEAITSCTPEFDRVEEVLRSKYGPAIVQRDPDLNKGKVRSFETRRQLGQTLIKHVCTDADGKLSFTNLDFFSEAQQRESMRKMQEKEEEHLRQHSGEGL